MKEEVQVFLSLSLSEVQVLSFLALLVQKYKD